MGRQPRGFRPAGGIEATPPPLAGGGRALIPRSRLFSPKWVFDKWKQARIVSEKSLPPLWGKARMGVRRTQARLFGRTIQTFANFLTYQTPSKASVPESEAARAKTRRRTGWVDGSGLARRRAGWNRRGRFRRRRAVLRGLASPPHHSHPFPGRPRAAAFPKPAPRYATLARESP